MGTYMNMTGTSKSSFFIGAKGVKLESVTEDTKQLLKVNGKIVITEDSALIPKELVTKIDVSDDGKSYIFTIKTETGETKNITIDTSNGGVKIEDAIPDTIPIIGTDTSLRSSEYKFVSNIPESNKEKSIPTISVVEEIINNSINPLTENLSKRLSGETAKIV